MRVVGSRLVELDDVNGWQSLPLPDLGSPLPTELETEQQIIVALELVSVYAGSRYRDTCISEVRGAVGRTGPPN